MADTPSGKGHGRRFCGAKKRSGLGDCTRPAGWGTDHPGYGACKFHGGSTPTVSRGAENDRIQDEARRALAGITDFEPVTNPVERLALLAGRAEKWMEKLGAIVEELQELRYATDTEQIDGRVLLYERAMALTGSLLSSFAKLGLDERLVRIEEAKARLIVSAVNAALQELGLDPAVQQEARKSVARHLRAVAGG